MSLIQLVVKHMLKQKVRIAASISKWQTSYLKKSHTFGIEPPKTVEQVLTLDAEKWLDSMVKELHRFKVGFKILLDGTKAPIGDQFVQYHIVFDIKMENFRCKVKLVAWGHIIRVTTIDSGVLRGIVRITLMIIAFNDLEVKLTDILKKNV